MERKDLQTKKRIIERFREFRKYPGLVTYDERFILLKFMFCLKGTGFEQYIAEYFKKFEGLDTTKVTGGIHDGGIDVKGKKGKQKIGIQCKNRTKQHIKEGDILYFIKQTNKIKQELGNNLSLYYITTNRLNPDAKHTAKQNGIKVKYYKDIIKMNKKMDIDIFINKYINNNNLIKDIKIYEILERFYYKKGIKSNFLGKIAYFISKFIRPIFYNNNFELDFDKAEKQSNKDDLFFLK